jgi:hypothetical protein
VDPDPRLAATAMRKGSAVLNLHQRQQVVDALAPA